MFNCCVVRMVPQVITKQGILEGKHCENFFGCPYYSFQGVPFAKPPLGKLRFKAPLPPEPWQGVKYATKEQEGCLCYDFLAKKVVGQEDCLYLNVYTPQLPSGEAFVPKAVMVYIHGGAFTSGSATDGIYGPHFLVTQNVVLVTITYRVGALGFLCLQDLNLEVPGNAGLKDQVMALKWVQENIKAFGGSPENVTIFGASAGGASVHYLVVSPMAKGLFHKAIMQSGSVFDPGARAKPTGVELCRFMDVNPKDEEESLKILQEAPALDVLMAQFSMKDTLTRDVSRPFAPIVEKPHKEAFLQDNPRDMVIQGKYNKVPMMLGCTSNEGLVSKILPEMQAEYYNLEKLIPNKLNIEEESLLAMIIVDKMKAFYFPNDIKVEGDPLHQLHADLLVCRGNHLATKHHCSTSPHPIYLYRFSMNGELNVIKELIQSTHSPGACHGDEIGYLFTNGLMKEVSNGSKEYRGVMIMIRLWTNFAKTGNPNNSYGLDNLVNVEWKPVTKEKMNFLDIDFVLKCGVAPNKERMAFWDEIYQMKSSTTKY